jgi:predicted amidohydrolase
MPNSTALDLFAIQAQLDLADYVSERAFRAKVFSYGPAVRAQRDPSLPAVVVFPEDIGMFLVALGAEKHLAGCATTDEAFDRLGKASLLHIAWAMARHRVTNVKTAFWLAKATAVRDTMIKVFSSFAHEHQVTVVAGSACLPKNKHGLVLRPFTPAGNQVYNLSYTFGPKGSLLAETAKVNLVPTMEDQIGLSAGTLGDIKVVDAQGGRLATAICYDGFRCAHTDGEPGFKPLIPYLDQAGADIVAQPSANPWPWEEKWVFAKAGDTRLRREQWLGEGAHSVLGGLSRTTLVVNPQLIASFLGLHFDGRSYIFQRDGQGVKVLAQAESIDRGEVIHARALVPARAAAAVNG